MPIRRLLKASPKEYDESETIRQGLVLRQSKMTTLTVRRATIGWVCLHLPMPYAYLYKGYSVFFAIKHSNLFCALGALWSYCIQYMMGLTLTFWSSWKVRFRRTYDYSGQALSTSLSLLLSCYLSFGVLEISLLFEKLLRVCIHRGSNWCDVVLAESDVHRATLQ